MKLKERVEFRLDPETKKMLQDLAHSRDQSLGETIRELIRQQLGTPASNRDKGAAARELINLGVRELPAPKELEEEIHRTFGQE